MTEAIVTKKKYLAPVDRRRIAADWLARGFSCDLFVDPPGRAWTDFVHRDNELLAVAEGRLEVEVEGERFLAEPGDEVFIPRGVAHSIKNVSASVTRWLYGYDARG